MIRARGLFFNINLRKLQDLFSLNLFTYATLFEIDTLQKHKYNALRP